MVSFPQTAAQQTPPGQTSAELRGQIGRIARQLEQNAQRRERLIGRLDRANGAEADQLRTELRDSDAATAELKANLSGLVGTLTQSELSTGFAQVMVPPVRAFGGPPFGINPGAVAIVAVVCVVIVASISRGLMRRVRRQPQAAVSSDRGGDLIVADRLTRIEQAVDAMAIEIERIAEGQRFVTKILTERPAGLRAAGQETSSVTGA